MIAYYILVYLNIFLKALIISTSQLKSGIFSSLSLSTTLTGIKIYLNYLCIYIYIYIYIYLSCSSLLLIAVTVSLMFSVCNSLLIISVTLPFSVVEGLTGFSAITLISKEVASLCTMSRLLFQIFFVKMAKFKI